MAEVVAGDGVGASPVGIGVDDLAVGDHQDDQQDDDGDGDGQDEVEGGGAGGGQHDQNGLGPVGHRGQRIERQGGQAFDRGDLLGRRLPDREGRSLQDLPDPGEAAHRAEPSPGSGSPSPASLRGRSRRSGDPDWLWAAGGADGARGDDGTV